MWSSSTPTTTEHWTPTALVPPISSRRTLIVLLGKACGSRSTTLTDGHSVLPLIKDKTAASRHKQLFWQWQKGWAVREGDWKLISKGSKGLGREKLDAITLVNLADDKPETKNYAAEKPEILKRLKELHNEWADDVFSKFKP